MKNNRTGWKMLVVICAISMIAAQPPVKKDIPTWGCLLKEPAGIIVEYNKLNKKHSDTCTSVWYNDNYGYKLHLMNGDSIYVNKKSVTWCQILSSGKVNKQQKKK